MSLKLPDEPVVGHLCCPALFIGFLRRYLEASGWPYIAVRLARVAAREIFSTVPVEVDLELVRLAAFAVPLELTLRQLL